MVKYAIQVELVLNSCDNSSVGGKCCSQQLLVMDENMATSVERKSHLDDSMCLPNEIMCQV